MLCRSGYRGHPDASHPVARAVIEASGCAFAAPSANLSGKPSPTNAQDVFTDMDGRLPLILDGGECDWGVESTVVSVVGEKPTLFRPGHITLEDLERALGEEVEVSKAILEKLPEGAVVRSPGMKYKHYAPKADVTLLDGTFEQFKAYVDAHAAENPSCLCFTGEAEKLGVPCVEYGREATEPTRQNTSSAPCVRWMSRAMLWSTPAAPRKTACPWPSITASSVRPRSG